MTYLAALVRGALAACLASWAWACNPSINIDLAGLEPLTVTGPQELAPLGTGLLDVTGGTPPYRFEIAGEAETGPQAAIDATHGDFRLGARGRVAERMRVTDAQGESRTIEIAVTDAISIDPTRAVVDPRGIADFDVLGGRAPYTFRIEGLSSDRIDPGTGIFEAGPTGGRSLAVVATDANGAEAKAEVQVTLTFGGGSNPHQLAALDLTRDGKLDIVVAGFGSGDLVVLEGDGTGNFRRTIEIPMLAFPRAIKVADLDGNGLMDLVVTAHSPSVLVGLVQDPDALGNLREVFRQPVANGPVDVEVIPLAPRRFSVLTVSEAGRANDRLEIALDGATGLVQTSTRVSLPERATRLVVGDFFGDDELDMVIGVRRGAADPSLLLYFLGVGNGRFASTPAHTFPAGLGTVGLAAGQLGGGPKADIAATYSTSNELAVLVDDPIRREPMLVRTPIPAGAGGQCEPCGRPEDATCAAGASCVLPKPGLVSTVCALTCGSALDCPNGTDCQDLAGVGRRCLPQLNVCPTTSLVSTGVNPRAAKIADLDLDGINEIVVSVVMSKSIEIYRTEGDNVFRRTSSAATGNNPWEMVITDVNGDAFPDVLTANRSGNNVSVLAGLGRLYTKMSDLQIGDSPNGTTVADFDRDPAMHNDVLVRQDGAYLTLIGDGRGGLVAYRRLEFSSPSVTEIVDLDVDGDLDFISFHGLSRTMEFVPWETGIGFTGGPETSTGIQPLGMGLADVDGDGKLDAIVANNLDYNFTLHLGAGDGSFSPYALDNVVHTYPTADILPRSVVTSTDQATHRLHYAVAMGLRGTSATFLDAIELDTRGQPTVTWSETISGNGTNLTRLDCNGDGRQDVLLTFSGVENNAFDAKVWRSFAGPGLEHAGDLHTGDPVPGQPGAFTATGPSSVAIEDFDADGKLDLVITTGLVRRIFLFGGNGDCTFRRIASVTTASSIGGLSAGDIDGDGLPELTGTIEPDRLVVYKNLGDRRSELRDFPEAGSFCAECTTDAECGTEADHCADHIGMRRICARDCSGGKACPRGFTCTDVNGAEQCLHEGDQCVY